MCVACRKVHAASTLMRLYIDQGDLAVQAGDARNRPGRGAYVCPRKECIDITLSKRRLASALRCKGQLNVTDEVRGALERSLLQMEHKVGNEN